MSETINIVPAGDESQIEYRTGELAPPILSVEVTHDGLSLCGFIDLLFDNVKEESDSHVNLGPGAYVRVATHSIIFDTAPCTTGVPSVFSKVSWGINKELVELIAMLGAKKSVSDFYDMTWEIDHRFGDEGVEGVVISNIVRVQKALARFRANANVSKEMDRDGKTKGRDETSYDASTNLDPSEIFLGLGVTKIFNFPLEELVYLSDTYGVSLFGEDIVIDLKPIVEVTSGGTTYISFDLRKLNHEIERRVLTFRNRMRNFLADELGGSISIIAAK